MLDELPMPGPFRRVPFVQHDAHAPQPTCYTLAGEAPGGRSAPPLRFCGRHQNHCQAAKGAGTVPTHP